MRTHRLPIHLRIVPALLTTALLLTACQADPPTSPATRTDQVEVDDDTFGPAVVAVEVGQTVTWTWVGSNDHNVVAEDGQFTSEVQDDGTFTWTPQAEGRIVYRCTLHPSMVGVVEVGAVPTSGVPASET